MFSHQVLSKISSYYPEFQLKYKDQSLFMRILGKLLFFSHSFMTTYTTTIGNTTYFPTTTFVNTKRITSIIVLLHELVHIHDTKKLGFWFKFSYLLPQIIVIPLLVLLFICSWKIIVPFICLSILPIPAYFRMIYEKRAYLASLYCMQALNQKFGHHIDLQSQSLLFVKQFSGPYYYYMWPFAAISKTFAKGLANINSGKRPYEDEIFDILDDILTVL